MNKFYGVIKDQETSAFVLHKLLNLGPYVIRYTTEGHTGYGVGTLNSKSILLQVGKLSLLFRKEYL